MTPDALTVVGLGLVGGSLARALLADGAIVYGWSESVADRAAGADAGITIINLGSRNGHDELKLRSSLAIVLAVPVDVIARVAATVVPSVAPETVVLHVGGLQSRAALGLSDALYDRVFGTHPIAGSHESGFAAARADLFAGCTVSVETRLPPAATEVATALWRRTGAARIVHRDAAEHDRLMAWVSHLPQVAATALAAALASAGVAPLDAGPGARDTTRIAASEPDAWRPVLGAQRAELLLGLATFEQTLARMREALDRGDDAAFATIVDAARRWRRAASPSA